MISFLKSYSIGSCNDWFSPWQTVMEDKPLSLMAKVTGTPRPEVTWYRNNKELVVTPNVKLSYEDDTCSLIIKKMTMDLEGQYKCVAQNPAGTTDISAKVVVEGKVMLIIY